MSQLAAQMHTLALNERMSSPHDAGSSEGRASAAATPVFEEERLAAKTPSILRRIKSDPHLGGKLMIDLEALAIDADEPEGGEVEDEDEDERWAHCSWSRSERPSLAREELAQARDDAEAKWRSMELTRSEALATATQPRGEDDMAIIRYSRTSTHTSVPVPTCPHLPLALVERVLGRRAHVHSMGGTRAAARCIATVKLHTHHVRPSRRTPTLALVQALNKAMRSCGGTSNCSRCLQLSVCPGLFMRRMHTRISRQRWLQGGCAVAAALPTPSAHSARVDVCERRELCV
jgi:hypothetical protein